MRVGTGIERARHVAEMARRAWVRAAINLSGVRNERLNALWEKYMKAERDVERLEVAAAEKEKRS